MISKAPPPTKAQKRRMDALAEFGCIACYRELNDFHTIVQYDMECQIHHFTRNNKRRGHDWTVPLCEYHHVGVHFSWHKTRRDFRERYGDDEALLAYTNRTIFGEGHE